jgi:hypothetical protein
MTNGVEPASLRITPHLVFGLLIILVGVLFTLDNPMMTDLVAAAPT